MKNLFREWPLLTISGILVVLLYCTFTGVSWAFYPEAYGPLTNYLSRLGNFNHSPFGAYFYNIGCILTGLMLVPFFVGLYEWWTTSRVGNAVLILGQIAGILSAFALVAIGVFSEDQGEPHLAASGLFFELNFVVLILVSIGLLFHSSFWRGIALYGLVLDISTLVFALAIGGPLIEWYTVFGSLSFVVLLAGNTFRRRRQVQERP